jgi:hypothetical protein
MTALQCVSQNLTIRKAYFNAGMTNQTKIEEVLKKILAGEQGAAPFIVQ